MRPRSARLVAVGGRERELAEAVERVLDSPDRRDAVALEAEEVDLVDVVEPAPGRGVAAPLAQVCRRAGEARERRRRPRWYRGPCTPRRGRARSRSMPP